MATLRQLLQVITDCDVVKDHMRKIEELRGQFNHKINLVGEPPKKYNYTCFEYAVNIHDYQEYINLKLDLWNRGIRDIFINSNFIEWLIQKKLLKSGDSIIIYFKNGKPKHAGVIKKDVVQSKWGKGNIYQHPIYEVPESYGDEIKCFQIYNNKQLFEYFNKYLSELGIVKN